MFVFVFTPNWLQALWRKYNDLCASFSVLLERVDAWNAAILRRKTSRVCVQLVRLAAAQVTSRQLLLWLFGFFAFSPLFSRIPLSMQQSIAEDVDVDVVTGRDREVKSVSPTSGQGWQIILLAAFFFRYRSFEAVYLRRRTHLEIFFRSASSVPVKLRAIPSFKTRLCSFEKVCGPSRPKDKCYSLRRKILIILSLLFVIWGKKKKCSSKFKIF